MALLNKWKQTNKQAATQEGGSLERKMCWSTRCHCLVPSKSLPTLAANHLQTKSMSIGLANHGKSDGGKSFLFCCYCMVWKNELLKPADRFLVCSVRIHLRLCLVKICTMLLRSCIFYQKLFTTILFDLEPMFDLMFARISTRWRCNWRPVKTAQKNNKTDPLDWLHSLHVSLWLGISRADSQGAGQIYPCWPVKSPRFFLASSRKQL